MEVKVISCETTVAEGKAIITEHTEKTLTLIDLNNLITQENQKQFNIKMQMANLKSEYDKSVINTVRYNELLTQIAEVDGLPAIE